MAYIITEIEDDFHGVYLFKENKSIKVEWPKDTVNGRWNTDNWSYINKCEALNEYKKHPSKDLKFYTFAYKTIWLGYNEDLWLIYSTFKDLKDPYMHSSILIGSLCFNNGCIATWQFPELNQLEEEREKYLKISDIKSFKCFEVDRSKDE